MWKTEPTEYGVAQVTWTDGRDDVPRPDPAANDRIDRAELLRELNWQDADLVRAQTEFETFPNPSGHHYRPGYAARVQYYSRHATGKWLARFDAVARSLGYTKQPKRSWW